VAREDSPCVYGAYWLDKRRDGASPDVWQIAWYETDTRQVRYRSTRKRDVDEASSVLRAHEQEQRAKGNQRPEDAKLIPLLFLYWREHGKDTRSAGQVASSLRQFVGFLMQDDATTDVTVAQLDKQLFVRFRKWRMGPHEYDVPWFGRDYKHSSPGVSGEAVQRNLDDVRAALYHHAGGRLPYVPKVPGVGAAFRSKARDRVLSIEQLGAIIGYAAYEIEALRWVLLMIGTAMRPEAALAMDPALQYRPLAHLGLVDLHPPKWPRTKKRNPVVPLIPELAPWLEAWEVNPHRPVKSRKVYWRTMRAALGLPADVVPKTIRHSVATILRARRVPGDDIELLLGHRVLKKTTEVYAKYDPEYLAPVRGPLSTIFAECCAAAKQWLAVHSLSTPKRGQCLTVIKNGSIPREMVVGADGLEPPTLSV
jgi:hypothetical protein